MSALVFDTETTGLWNFKAPPTDPSQPRLLQLGCQLLDDKLEVAGEFNMVIKPDGWTVPDEAAAIHGISTEYANQYGIPVKDALVIFCRLLHMSKRLVAHNFNFDVRVVEGELVRLDVEQAMIFKARPSYCTMLTSTKICNIAGPRGPKWPKLTEAYRHFFGEELTGAHDAMVDVRACSRIFRHHISSGIAVL